MPDTKLDRDLQRRILVHLNGIYPNSQGRLDRAFHDVAADALTANLRYLHQHRLIEASWIETNTGGLQVGTAALTAMGADFLADDGGLSAILNVVTVKLHGDTIKELLVEHVEKSTADPSVKAKLVDRIKSLPAAALETATLEAVKSGLRQVPDLVGWLSKLLP